MSTKNSVGENCKIEIITEHGWIQEWMNGKLNAHTVKYGYVLTYSVYKCGNIMWEFEGCYSQIRLIAKFLMEETT